MLGLRERDSSALTFAALTFAVPICGVQTWKAPILRALSPVRLTMNPISQDGRK